MTEWWETIPPECLTFPHCLESKDTDYLSPNYLYKDVCIVTKLGWQSQ